MVQKVALRPYLHNLAAEANPIFRNRWLSLGDRLLEDTEINTTAVGRSLRIHTILSLGATGTGVGFHSHTENWLAQVQGRKAWSRGQQRRRRGDGRHLPLGRGGPLVNTQRHVHWSHTSDAHPHSSPDTRQTRKSGCVGHSPARMRI